MIGGLFDALLGKSDFKATAPQINTQAGQLAIQQQGDRAAQQARAGQASMAAQARGPSAALAMREAQKRGAQASQDIGAATAAQQNQMAQQAAVANQQASMQAQQVNAQIAAQNAGGLQRLAGLGLMGAGIAFGGPAGAAAAGSAGGAMMSDRRQKEIIYSDFRDKELPPSDFDLDYIIRYGEAPAAPQRENPYPAMERDAQTMRELEALRVAKEAEIAGPRPLHEQVHLSPRPAPARSMVVDPNGPLGYRPDPNAEGRAAFGLPSAGSPQPMRPSLSQAASERATIESIRSPSAEYIPQQTRDGVQPEMLGNQAIAQHLQGRREREQLESMAAADGVRLPPERIEYPRLLTKEPTPAQVQDQRGASLFEMGAKMARGDTMMASDKREKETAFARGAAAGAAMAAIAPAATAAPGRMVKLAPAARPAFDVSPQRVNRMAEAERRAMLDRELAEDRKRGAFRSLADAAKQSAVMDARIANREGMAPVAVSPAAVMPSDYRDKEISRENLDPVEPTVYRYTPESSMRQAVEHGMRGEDPARIYEDRREPRLGIVAQDLQDSPLFDEAVVDDDPTQLAIDRDRATSLALAELGRVNERMSAIEDAISRRKKVA